MECMGYGTCTDSEMALGEMASDLWYDIGALDKSMTLIKK
jgi:hypothetical protein